MKEDLPAHGLKIVLVEPEIPPNTGNIARLCGHGDGAAFGEAAGIFFDGSAF